MKTLRLCVVALVGIVLLSDIAPGQRTRIPPFTGANYINDFILGDTLASGERRDLNAIYELEHGGIYLANAPMDPNFKLTLVANDTTPGIGPPIIYLYPNPTTQLPPGHFARMSNHFKMTGIILVGYFEPIPDNIGGLQGSLVRTGASGFDLEFEDCMLLNTNGNHIRTDQAARVVKVTDCIIADMGYLGRSNLGAGKGIDLRAGSCDSLVIRNSTFVNWQDRIIRHFSSTANIQTLIFEHNTLVNGMSYHGMMSLGRVGRKVVIRDNLFVDPFALGNDSDAVRQSEFTDSGEIDDWGFPRMSWIFCNPNDSTLWVVNNNYYHISPDGQQFWTEASTTPIVANPPLTMGSPLSYHINSRLGADSATAFQSVDVTLPTVPELMVAMMKWYRKPEADGGAGKTKGTGNWSPAVDFDRHTSTYYRDTLDCAYSTSHSLYTAATGGYPIGDLNWFPDRYAEWLQDPVSSVGDLPEGIPSEYSLEQNYPNPFNPSTQIAFSLPRESHVTVEVFDIVGRRVAKLIDEKREAGTHTVEFNAAGLSSGVYFYTMVTSGQTLTRKMMLIK